MNFSNDNIDIEKERLELEKKLLRCSKTGEGNIEEIMNSLCTKFPNEWKFDAKKELDEYRKLENDKKEAAKSLLKYFSQQNGKI